MPSGGKEFNFRLPSVMRTTKKFHLTQLQINYWAPINFNVGAEEYPKYARADVKQQYPIEQIKYSEAIPKNMYNTSVFLSSEQLRVLKMA